MRALNKKNAMENVPAVPVLPLGPALPGMGVSLGRGSRASVGKGC